MGGGTVKARINIVGAIPDKGTTVELDGVDYAHAIHALTLDSSYDNVSDLTLHMRVLNGWTFEGEVNVRVPSDVEEALVALGWTPPPTPALAEPPAG